MAKQKVCSQTHWTDDQDFQDDLYAVSDFGPTHHRSPPTQPSVNERRARSKASIFEEFDDQSTQPPRRGRGRSMLWGNVEVSPGGMPSFLQKQLETSNEIRATNRYGYCNDHIEHFLKSDSDNVDIQPMDKIRLNGASPTESLKSSSRSSTPSQISSSSSACETSDVNVSREAAQVTLRDVVKRNNNPRLNVGDSSNLFNKKVDTYININSYVEFPKL